MNREDVCRYVGSNGAVCGLFAHTHVNHQIGHAFRPARGEAPQGKTCDDCLIAAVGSGQRCAKHRTQPETGGDEARVREIAERWRDVVGHSARTNAIDVIEPAVREAFAAGRAAENPRCAGCGQIHGPCNLCPSGLCSAHQPVEGMVENISRELATAVVFIADNCTSEAAAALINDLSGYQVVAEAVAARRGSGR